MAHPDEGAPSETSQEDAERVLGARGSVVMLLDTRGTVVGWSEGARELLGYRAEEIVDRPVPLVARPAADGPPAPEDATTSVQPPPDGGTLPSREHGTTAPRDDGTRTTGHDGTTTARNGGATAPLDAAQSASWAGGTATAWNDGPTDAWDDGTAAPQDGAAPMAVAMARSVPAAATGEQQAVEEPAHPPTGPPALPYALPPTLLERLRGEEHWAELANARHREGHAVPVDLEGAPLVDEAGELRWLVTVTDVSDPDAGAATGSSVMRTLLDHSPVALAIWDRDLRCVWLNTTAEHETNAFRNRQRGAPMRQALRGFDTDTVEPVMRETLETGRPVIDHEFRWTSEDGTQERVFSSSIFRLDQADGTPLGVCTIAVDITRSWARERLALLSRAGKRIGTTLDVMTTAQELADVTVPLLADFVTVDLAESVPLGEEPLERLSSSDAGTVPVFRRAAAKSLTPGTPESIFNVGDPVYVPPSSPFTYALATGEPQFEPVLDTRRGWLSDDPDRAAAIARAGMHSQMVLPLKARGTILGVAVFIRYRNLAPFSRDDLLLAEELVVQAALNLDNARRYTRERSAALALQRNLLPQRLTGGAALDVASRYLPTDRHEGVGGDWYDAIQLPGGRVGLIVGDVVGHGINAAATMGRLRTAVHTLADLDLPPDELLTHLDDLAVHLSEDNIGPDGFPAPVVSATCVYAVYDPVTRKCSVARAGHPPPAVLLPGRGVTFPDLPVGAPIGLGLASYESVELELPEGSLLALFTDGLIESRTSDIDAGMDRLAAVLDQPAGDLDAYCASVIEGMVSRGRPEDDIALLTARTRVLGPDETAAWQLPRDPAVVQNARALAMGQLTEWGLPQLTPSVELIVSELVTNSIQHGSGPIELRLIRHGRLVCEVSDSDVGSTPRMRRARDTEERGRGLFLVARLSERWGSRLTATGKTTWAEVRLPVAA